MDIIYISSRLITGLFIGFTIGLTGIGGGVLVIPALTLLFRLPPTLAVGTASLYALITKAYAFWEHFKLKTINFKMGLFFLIGAIPANIITSLWINYYAAENQNNLKAIQAFQSDLKIFIGITLLLSVLLLIIDLFKKGEFRLFKKSDTKFSQGKKFLGIISGFIIGALIGATSIGGGVLVIPLLIIIFHLKPDRTVGTSIFIAVILLLATAIIYGQSGQVDYGTAGIMSIGSLLGVYLGSRLSVKIPEKQLELLVTLIILVATVMMFF